eukprot:TRINITY_DN2285_c0_g1_i1.p1 TRINITY_DN2285_c0_g1~~TRINITY_DN2285_c0_g1_i1.p1  ORF type:complete len:283 (+),score=69.38 TRINITY_DN2285_c0_g1_i1:268-1116(+)
MENIYELNEENKGKLGYLWAQKLNKRTLINVYLLFSLLIARFNMHVSGDNGIARDIRVFFTKEEIEDFENCFPLKSKRFPNKKGNFKTFPFQKGYFAHKKWEISNYHDLEDFLSLFKNLRPEIEIIRGVDFEDRSQVKEISPRDYWSYMRKEKDIEEFFNTFPSNHAYFVRAKIAIGRYLAKFYRFSISFVDYSNVIPGGYMSFQFNYARILRGSYIGRKLITLPDEEINFNIKKDEEMSDENNVTNESMSSLVEKHREASKKLNSINIELMLASTDESSDN